MKIINLRINQFKMLNNHFFLIRNFILITIILLTQFNVYSQQHTKKEYVDELKALKDKISKMEKEAATIPLEMLDLQIRSINAKTIAEKNSYLEEMQRYNYKLVILKYSERQRDLSKLLSLALDYVDNYNDSLFTRKSTLKKRVNLLNQKLLEYESKYKDVIGVNPPVNISDVTRAIKKYIEEKYPSKDQTNSSNSGSTY